MMRLGGGVDEERLLPDTFRSLLGIDADGTRHIIIESFVGGQWQQMARLGSVETDKFLTNEMMGGLRYKHHSHKQASGVATEYFMIRMSTGGEGKSVVCGNYDGDMNYLATGTGGWQIVSKTNEDVDLDTGDKLGGYVAFTDFIVTATLKEHMIIATMDVDCEEVINEVGFNVTVLSNDLSTVLSKHQKQQTYDALSDEEQRFKFDFVEGVNVLPLAQDYPLGSDEIITIRYQFKAPVKLLTNSDGSVWCHLRGKKITLEKVATQEWIESGGNSERIEYTYEELGALLHSDLKIGDLATITNKAINYPSKNIADLPHVTGLGLRLDGQVSLGNHPLFECYNIKIFDSLFSTCILYLPSTNLAGWEEGFWYNDYTDKLHLRLHREILTYDITPEERDVLLNETIDFKFLKPHEAPDGVWRWGYKVDTFEWHYYELDSSDRWNLPTMNQQLRLRYETLERLTVKTADGVVFFDTSARTLEKTERLNAKFTGKYWVAEGHMPSRYNPISGTHVLQGEKLVYNITTTDTQVLNVPIYVDNFEIEIEEVSKIVINTPYPYEYKTIILEESGSYIFDCDTTKWTYTYTSKYIDENIPKIDGSLEYTPEHDFAPTTKQYVDDTTLTFHNQLIDTLEEHNHNGTYAPTSHTHSYANPNGHIKQDFSVDDLFVTGNIYHNSDLDTNITFSGNQVHLKAGSTVPRLTVSTSGTKLQSGVYITAFDNYLDTNGNLSTSRSTVPVSGAVRDSIKKTIATKVPDKMGIVKAEKIASNVSKIIYSDSDVQFYWNKTTLQFQYYLFRTWAWHDSGIWMVKNGNQYSSTGDVNSTYNDKWNHFNGGADGNISTTFKLASYGNFGICHLSQEQPNKGKATYILQFYGGATSSLAYTLTKIMA